jgi:hypothetical protein
LRFSGYFSHFDVSGSKLNHVPKLFLLGTQISHVMWCKRADRGNTLDDVHPMRFQLLYFARIIRDQPNRLDAEALYDLRCNVKFACVDWKAEFQIGFDCVTAKVLQPIDLDFIA